MQQVPAKATGKGRKEGGIPVYSNLWTDRKFAWKRSWRLVSPVTWLWEGNPRATGVPLSSGFWCNQSSPQYTWTDVI